MPKVPLAMMRPRSSTDQYSQRAALDPLAGREGLSVTALNFLMCRDWRLAWGQAQHHKPWWRHSQGVSTSQPQWLGGSSSLQEKGHFPSGKCVLAREDSPSDGGQCLQFPSFSLSQNIPTPEDQVTKSIWFSTPPHGCPQSHWEWSNLSLEGKGQGHSFISESSGIDSSTHASSHTGFSLPHKHGKPIPTMLLSPRIFFPSPSHGSCIHFLQVAPEPVFPRIDFPSWSCLNQLPPFCSSHSPTPCPILFPFKGLITTWKNNNCYSSLTGYLQRTGW